MKETSLRIMVVPSGVDPDISCDDIKALGSLGVKNGGPFVECLASCRDARQLWFKEWSIELKRRYNE